MAVNKRHYVENMLHISKVDSNEMVTLGVELNDIGETASCYEIINRRFRYGVVISKRQD